MLAVLTFSLQSGSSGNSIYVETDGTRLLFDAGISGRQALQRMQRHNRTIRGVDALLISHDHNDHVCCAGIYHRVFQVPLYVTRKTHRAIARKLGKTRDLRYFEAGQTLHIGRARIHTIPTPHDAVDGVAFIVEGGGRRLGLFTDLGHPFPALQAALREVDAAYVESNYDPHMLETGPYPQHLKARIRGPAGHLSNDESAELLGQALRANPRLRWAVLAHLSEHNNHPGVALQTHRRRIGKDFPIHVASRRTGSPLFSIDATLFDAPPGHAAPPGRDTPAVACGFAAGVPAPGAASWTSHSAPANVGAPAGTPAPPAPVFGGSACST